ncbi:type VII secretion protein EccE [Mycolicibacterium sp. CBM1]
MRVIGPGSGRIALVVLAVVPAVMAYPWRTVPERWALAVAVMATVVLFGSWRGLHLTTIAQRRLGLLLCGRRRTRAIHQTVEHCDADARTTVVLRVLEGNGDLPLDLIAGYLDRYGVRCDAMRVTTRDISSRRTTWIGLTMSVTANLVALQSRSVTIPLRKTAELTARRLADQLRERGWMVSGGDLDIPDLLGPQAREHWATVADGSSGYVTAYSVVGRSLPETLTSLWAGGFDEVWTVIEISARGAAAACAIRSADLPGHAPPLSGLASSRGNQWAAVQALSPTSTKHLDIPLFDAGELAAIRWHQGTAVRT